MNLYVYCDFETRTKTQHLYLTLFKFFTELKKLTGIAAILRFPVAEENSDDSDWRRSESL